MGMELWGTEETANRDEMLEYARRYDPWPMHIDEAVATRGPFGGLIASGGYTISLWYRSGHGASGIGPTDEPHSSVDSIGTSNFHKPLRPDEKVRARSVITDMKRSSKPGRGIVTHKADLLDREDDLLLEVDVVFLIASRVKAVDGAD